MRGMMKLVYHLKIDELIDNIDSARHKFIIYLSSTYARYDSLL